MKSKALIVFKGRYGATEQYARWLGEVLHAPVYESEEITDAKLNEFDVVIAGGSVYVGKIQIAKWMNDKKKVLANKPVFLFIVCASPDISEVQRSQMLAKNIDKSLLDKLTVYFLKGRMIKKELSMMDYFILRMGAAMQKSSIDKKRMLTDFDDVKMENLDELIKAVESAPSFAKRLFEN